VSGGEEAGKEKSHGCDGDNGAAAAIPRWELEGSPPSAVPKIVNVTPNGQRHLGNWVKQRAPLSIGVLECTLRHKIITSALFFVQQIFLVYNLNFLTL
jgi:hypothetical protein